MSALSFDSIEIGDTLAPFGTDPITRASLALFAGAAGDHNPMHIDIDFARQAGFDDVFAHGMLVMAYLGRALEHWAAPGALRSFGVRFVAITHLGDAITCTATVLDKQLIDGERHVRLDIAALNQAGEAKLRGEAVVALP
jgi:acyl dehydratase